MSVSHISNREVVPEIESDLFVGREDLHLAVGIVALGDVILPGLEREFRGYTLLRGNVYARQKNYMRIDHLNDDGTETDLDDKRSVHFALIENAVKNPRVVGAMRLIIKSKDSDAPLPVEEHYPEAFADNPAPLLSAEVSRLICRHEVVRVQNKLKWPLVTASVQYIRQKQLGPVFGAVEKSFERSLRVTGVPITPLGKAEFVPEFNASKLPIRIDINGLAQHIEGRVPELMNPVGVFGNNFVYSGTLREEEPAIS